jgi:hypothetical protein
MLFKGLLVWHSLGLRLALVLWPTGLDPVIQYRQYILYTASFYLNSVGGRVSNLQKPQNIACSHLTFCYANNLND